MYGAMHRPAIKKVKNADWQKNIIVIEGYKIDHCSHRSAAFDHEHGRVVSFPSPEKFGLLRPPQAYESYSRLLQSLSVDWSGHFEFQPLSVTGSGRN